MSARVFFVNSVGKLGGAEHSLLGLLAGLDRRRFEPLLACPPDSALADRARALGVPVATIPMVAFNTLRSPWAYASALAALVRQVGAWRPDIIHGNGMRSIHYAVPLARLARAPVLIHVRDLALPPSRLTRALLRGADAQIAISQAVRASLEAGGVKARRCAVVHNGIDPAPFLAAAGRRAATRAGLGLPGDAVAIGMVGRLVPWKGQRTVVEAAALLRDDPHLRWLIVGEEWTAEDTGDPQVAGYVTGLHARVAEQGLAGRVTFLGQRDDIPDLMAACDVVVVPSVEPEPFGRVAIEALAAGTPVVATDAGGLVEIVVEGEVGYRVPLGDAAALADRVGALAARPELRYGFGVRGRDLVAARFSLDAYVQGVCAVYEALLAASRR